MSCTELTAGAVTRTEPATKDGRYFCIGSNKDGINFDDDPYSGKYRGVGVSISFSVLPTPLPEEDIET